MSGGWLLGVDLGGTKLALALADGEGRLVAKQRRPTEPSGDPARDLDRIAQELRALLDSQGVAISEVAAVGVSAPGPIDVHAGVLIDPPNLPGWGRVPVRATLESALGCVVTLENDANAAALAEWRYGAGRRDAASGGPIRDFVYLTMSTGVGGGLILDGRLHRGVGGLAGEVGHVPVEWDGLPCACGRRGCLEAYVGGAAWARRLAEITPQSSRVFALAEGRANATPVHLVQAAREGDAFALEEMARFNEYLARALVGLVFTLAPRVIAFGTIVQAAGEALCLAPVRAMLRERLWPSFADAVELVPAALGEELPYRAGLAVAHDHAQAPARQGAGR